MHQLANALERQMQLYGNEKDKGNLFNIERREKIVHDVFLRAAQLSQPLKDYKPTDFNTVGDIRQPWEDPVHLFTSTSSSSSLALIGSVVTSNDVVRCLGSITDVGSETTKAVTTNTVTTNTVTTNTVTTNTVHSSSSSSSERVDQGDINRSNSSNGDSIDQIIHAVRAVDMEEQIIDHSVVVVEISKAPDKSLTRNVTFSLNERDINTYAITDVSLITGAARAAEAAMGDLEYLLSGCEDNLGDSQSNGSAGGEIEERRSGVDDAGAVTMTVVFDGSHRALCDFKIKLTSDHALDGDMNGESEGVSTVLLKDEIGEEEISWVRDNIISSVSDKDVTQLNEMISIKTSQTHSSGSGSGNGTHSSSSEKCNDQIVASVELTQFTDIDEDLSVFLGHKTVRPKIEDDDISRMIYVDRLSYTGDNMMSLNLCLSSLVNR